MSRMRSPLRYGSTCEPLSSPFGLEGSPTTICYSVDNDQTVRMRILTLGLPESPSSFGWEDLNLHKTQGQNLALCRIELHPINFSGPTRIRTETFQIKSLVCLPLTLPTHDP